MPKRLLLLIAVCGLIGIPYSHAAMTFTVTFTAQAQSDLSAAEQSLFTDGLAFWDDIIIEHRDGVARTWNLNVDTFSSAASGGTITLGSANASGLAFSGVVGDSHTSDGRFIISTGGNASFNVHPDAGSLSGDTIKHEIGHALGIGTLWEDNEVHNDGVGGNHNRTLAGGTPGHYVGAAGLAAYQAEFDAGATFVPVELDGGAGTAGAHWNEVADNPNVENVSGFDSDPGDGGPAPTSGDGSLDDELMTGMQSGSSFLSNTTHESLYDIGFSVVPVPEPGSIVLLGLGCLIAGFRRRR